MPETLQPSKPVPDTLKGCLWSYDFDALDVVQDAWRVITNVLIYGDILALKWLFSTYSRKAISNVVEYPFRGEWDAKSLFFWAGYFQGDQDKKALKSLEIQGSSHLRY